MRAAREEAAGGPAPTRCEVARPAAPSPRRGPAASLAPVILLAAASPLVHPAPAQPRETGLWVEGNRLQAIAVPADASADVRYAAAELRHYVHQRCRDELPLRETNVLLPTPAAYVGPWEWSPALPADGAKPSEEGVFICAGEGALSLTGGGPGGVIYAVSAFLQRRLGIRWYQPSPWGEEVPLPGRVLLPPFRYIHEPSFWYRDISVCIHESISEWAVRNRLNTNLGSFAEERGGCQGHAIGGHASSKYIEPGLFESHPEYFALKDGERWLDPINAVALTTDLDLDLEAKQSEHSPNSIPVVVRAE